MCVICVAHVCARSCHRDVAYHLFRPPPLLRRARVEGRSADLGRPTDALILHELLGGPEETS